MGVDNVHRDMHVRVLQKGGSSGSVRLNVPSEVLEELNLEGGDSIALNVNGDEQKVEIKSCDDVF